MAVSLSIFTGETLWYASREVVSFPDTGETSVLSGSSVAHRNASVMSRLIGSSCSFVSNDETQCRLGLGLARRVVDVKTEVLGFLVTRVPIYGSVGSVPFLAGGSCFFFDIGDPLCNLASEVKLHVFKVELRLVLVDW